MSGPISTSADKFAKAEAEKTTTMFRSLLLLCCGVTAMACASRLDRVVSRAAAGLAYDARYEPTPGGDSATLMFLEQRARWLGVTVTFVPKGHQDLGGAMGLSYMRGPEKHVVVDNTLSVNGRLEVLAHELAHLFQPPLEVRSEGQVFAELVSVEVCRRLGVDTSAAAVLYLQNFKSALRVAQVYRAEIAYVSDMLTDGYAWGQR